MLQEITNLLFTLIWSDEARVLFGGSWFYPALAANLLLISSHYSAPVRTAAKKCVGFCVSSAHRTARLLRALSTFRPQLLATGRSLVKCLHLLYF
jgi:hypothetical protein